MSVPLINRCCGCCETRSIVGAKSKIRYGQRLTLLYCADCNGVEAPVKPLPAVIQKQTGCLKKGYLSAPMIEQMGRSAASLILEAIGSGQLLQFEINRAIKNRHGNGLRADLLARSLKILVESGRLEVSGQLKKAVYRRRAIR